MMITPDEESARLLNTICNRREYTTADFIAAAEKNFKALWAESVEESDPGTAKAIQVQASKVALTYFIALTRNWMDEVESDLNSRRRRNRMTDKERRNKLKALIYLERALALDEKHFFFQLIDDETIHVTDIESGNSRLVNVACDNIPAMLYDILKQAGAWIM